METNTIQDLEGRKVGVAVWSGDRDDRGVMINWECFNLSDHSVGVVKTAVQAVGLLNDF